MSGSPTSTLALSPPRSIGASDFRQLRERGSLYVDKTAFVARVLDDPGDVLLLPRPRRFGKTTNLSTLRYYLEKSAEDHSPLFAGLAIWQETRLREHFGLGGQGEVESLTRALLAGDLEVVEERLGRLLTESTSFLDTTTSRMPPEQVYHAFILGLLVQLQPPYLVRSNRESGQGRFDVMILPRSAGQPGVVLELKVKKKGETLKQALAKALGQIETQDYAAELRAVGASPIHKMAFAFDGKKVIAGSLSTHRPPTSIRRRT